MFGWTAADIPFFVVLPLLLIGSAFFSGSETALFGLSNTQRMTLRARGTIASRAADTLLEEPRMLLITVLLGNMVMNVLYFVISSVLLIKATEANWLGQVLLAVASLLIIILLGEVLPKQVANSTRMSMAVLIAPPLLAAHRLIGPLRAILEVMIVAPLSRLTAPTAAPPALATEDLATLLDLSGDEGIIDRDEQQILNEVIRLHNLRAKHVMTPRVRMRALPTTASPDDVLMLAHETRLTKFPVFEGDIDHIAGILHVKRFVLDDRLPRGPAGSHVAPVMYLPETATLDHVLEEFRVRHAQLAIVVDEYGGTAGLITIEDIVRRIAGDLWESDQPPVSEGGATA